MDADEVAGLAGILHNRRMLIQSMKPEVTWPCRATTNHTAVLSGIAGHGNARSGQDSRAGYAACMR